MSCHFNIDGKIFKLGVKYIVSRPISVLELSLVLICPWQEFYWFYLWYYYFSGRRSTGAISGINMSLAGAPLELFLISICLWQELHWSYLWY